MNLLKSTIFITLLLLFSLRLSKCQEQEFFAEEYNSEAQIEEVQEAPQEEMIEEAQEEQPQEASPQEAPIEEEDSEECPQYMQGVTVNGYDMVFYPCCVSSSAQCDDNPVPVCLEQLNCEGGSCTTNYVTVTNECQACQGHNNLQFAHGECPWEAEEEDEELMCPESIELKTVNGVSMDFYYCCVSSKEQCDNHYSPVCLEDTACEGGNCDTKYTTVVNMCNACQGHSNLQYARGECPSQVTNDCPKFIEETEVDGYWMTFHPCCVDADVDCEGTSVEPICIEQLRCEAGHCRRHYETSENLCSACKGHKDWMYSKGQCPWDLHGDRDGQNSEEGEDHRSLANAGGDGKFLN